MYIHVHVFTYAHIIAHTCTHVHACMHIHVHMYSTIKCVEYITDCTWTNVPGMVTWYTLSSTSSSAFVSSEIHVHVQHHLLLLHCRVSLNMQASYEPFTYMYVYSTYTEYEIDVYMYIYCSNITCHITR